MTTHILVEGECLCGCNSVTCLVNSADCQRCQKRLDNLLTALIAALDDDKKRQEAKALVNKLGLSAEK